MFVCSFNDLMVSIPIATVVLPLLVLNVHKDSDIRSYLGCVLNVCLWRFNKYCIILQLNSIAKYSMPLYDVVSTITLREIITQMEFPTLTRPNLNPRFRFVWSLLVESLQCKKYCCNAKRLPTLILLWYRCQQTTTRYVISTSDLFCFLLKNN